MYQVAVKIPGSTGSYIRTNFSTLRQACRYAKSFESWWKIKHITKDGIRASVTKMGVIRNWPPLSRNSLTLLHRVRKELKGRRIKHNRYNLTLQEYIERKDLTPFGG